MNGAANLIPVVASQSAVPAVAEAEAQPAGAGDFAALLAQAGAAAPGADDKPVESEASAEAMAALAAVLNSAIVVPQAPSLPPEPVLDAAGAEEALTTGIAQTSVQTVVPLPDRIPVAADGAMAASQATEAVPSTAAAPAITAPPATAATPANPEEVVAESIADVLKEIALGAGADTSEASTAEKNSSGQGVALSRTVAAAELRDAGQAGGKTSVATMPVHTDRIGESATRGQHMLRALLDQASARVSTTDGEIRTVTGVELYAHTRETVAGNAAATTGQPEALKTPVGTPRWANELGSRLVVMTLRGQQEGSLSLTPEHLGPVEVRISMNQDTTSLWFGAQHAETRAALTEALPRLREMFAASGLSLGHAGVSQEAPRQESRPAEQRGQIGHSGSLELAEAVTPVTENRRIRAGSLDAWA